MNVISKQDIFVSVIVICENQTSITSKYIDDVVQLLTPNFKHFEILLVNNGLNQNEYSSLASSLTNKVGVRMLTLTKSFPIDSAIFAGLEACIGERILLLIPETDYPKQIPNLVSVLSDKSIDIAQWMSDTEEKSRGLVDSGRKLFFALNRRFLNLDISSRTTYLTVLSRRAVQALTDISRTHRYFKHLITHIGYPITSFTYSPRNIGYKNKSLSVSVTRAIEMVSSYSTKPLRMMTTVGLLSAIASVIYAIYVVVLQFTNSNVVEGWTTTSLQISLMFFVISLVLSIQSEYIGRILTESRKEPIYILKEELESDIPIPGSEQRNVEKS